jgi:site-specific recombinase XerD
LERAQCAVPVAPEVLAAYLEGVYGRLASSTVRTRLCMIRRVHRAVGLEDPTRSRAVELAVRRGQRAHGSRVRQAEGLNAPLRDRVLAACGEDPLGLRDRVMISVGYDLLARGCELVALRIDDLRPGPGAAAYVLMRPAKHSLRFDARPAYLSERSRDHIARWLAATGFNEGPLLRPIQHGAAQAGPITPQTIGHRLKRLGQAAGFDPCYLAGLSSHSLRVGGAQDLASAGRTLLEIMLAGRWRDLSSVADYTRDAQVNVWAPGDGDTYAHLTGVEARVRRFDGAGTASTARRRRA